MKQTNSIIFNSIFSYLGILYRFLKIMLKLYLEMQYLIYSMLLSLTIIWLSLDESQG